MSMFNKFKLCNMCCIQSCMLIREVALGEGKKYWLKIQMFPEPILHRTLSFFVYFSSVGLFAHKQEIHSLCIVDIHWINNCRYCEYPEWVSIIPGQDLFGASQGCPVDPTRQRERESRGELWSEVSEANPSNSYINNFWQNKICVPDSLANISHILAKRLYYKKWKECKTSQS